MHEDIMRFSSRWFYQDELQAAPEVKHRGILAYDTPVVWFDTADCDFEEDQLSESQSRINKKRGGTAGGATASLYRKDQ